jgi:polysaccharide deacetylase 2 family uncharacterized protein YibQ
LKKEDLFFVDSRTSASSLGYKLAGQMGVKTGRNQLFLDNSSEVSQIKKKIWEAAASLTKTVLLLLFPTQDRLQQRLGGSATKNW